MTNLNFKEIPKCLALLATLACASVKAAPDVSLEVTHRSVSLGADGIQRSTVFTERVLRRGDTVWVERVVPAQFRHDAPHTAAKALSADDHRHADLGAATRWIQKGVDGKPTLRLVSSHERIVVSIAPAEFATVGFDGSWPAAYHLIDPAVLKRLKPAGKDGEGQWFESAKADAGNQIRVLWNQRLEMPLQVQTRSGDGLSSRSTTVRVLAAAEKKPWDSTVRYASKDYSDFLD